MKYEYKSVWIVRANDSMSSEAEEVLNKWFDSGWEYVDKIVQSVSAGSYSNKGAVMVILRKEKSLLPE